MSFISVFDVMGPNMIGPSSSHTAGAARIAFLAQKMIKPPLKKVEFILYGSFARTYKGHGTDPVSYTHLDVYKRQAQCQIKAHGCLSLAPACLLHHIGLVNRPYMGISGKKDCKSSEYHSQQTLFFLYSCHNFLL